MRQFKRLPSWNKLTLNNKLQVVLLFVQLLTFGILILN